MRDRTNSKSKTQSKRNSRAIYHEKKSDNLKDHAILSSPSNINRSGPPTKGKHGTVTGILQNTKGNGGRFVPGQQSTTSQVTIQSPNNNNFQTSIGYTDMLSAFSGQGAMESNERISRSDLLNVNLSNIQAQSTNQGMLKNSNVFDAQQLQNPNQIMMKRIQEMENMIKHKYAPPPVFYDRDLVTDPEIGGSHDGFIERGNLNNTEQQLYQQASSNINFMAASSINSNSKSILETKQRITDQQCSGDSLAGTSIVYGRFPNKFFQNTIEDKESQIQTSRQQLQHDRNLERGRNQNSLILKDAHRQQFSFVHENQLNSKQMSNFQPFKNGIDHCKGNHTDQGQRRSFHDQENQFQKSSQSGVSHFGAHNLSPEAQATDFNQNRHQAIHVNQVDLIGQNPNNYPIFSQLSSTSKLGPDLAPIGPDQMKFQQNEGKEPKEAYFMRESARSFSRPDVSDDAEPIENIRGQPIYRHQSKILNKNKQKLEEMKQQLKQLPSRRSQKQSARQQHISNQQFEQNNFNIKFGGVDIPASFQNKLDTSFIQQRDGLPSSNTSTDQIFQRRDSSHSGVNAGLYGSMRQYKENTSYHTQNVSRNMHYLNSNQGPILATPLYVNRGRVNVQTAQHSQTDFNKNAQRISSNLAKMRERSSDLTLRSQTSALTPNKKSVRINENFHGAAVNERQNASHRKNTGSGSGLKSAHSRNVYRTALSNHSMNSGDDQSCVSQNTRGILKSSKSRERNPSHLSKSSQRPLQTFSQTKQEYKRSSIGHDHQPYLDLDRQSKLVNQSKSYRRSQVSSHQEIKLTKHKGYDRPINAVPIDEIPRAAQNSRVVYTKHIYPHFSSKLKMEDNRSKWAPSSYLQQQLNDLHDQTVKRNRVMSKQGDLNPRKKNSLKSRKSSLNSERSNKRSMSRKSNKIHRQNSYAKSENSQYSRISSHRSKNSKVSRKSQMKSILSRSLMSGSKPVQRQKMSKKEQDELCDRLSRRSKCSRKSLIANSTAAKASMKAKCLSKSRSKGSLGRQGSQYKRLGRTNSKPALMKTPSVQDHAFHISNVRQSAQKHTRVSALSQYILPHSTVNQYDSNAYNSTEQMGFFPFSGQSNKNVEESEREPTYKNEMMHRRHRSTSKKGSMLIENNKTFVTDGVGMGCLKGRKYSQTSKKSNRSISQEYLSRTGKKRYPEQLEPIVLNQSIIGNNYINENGVQNMSTGRVHKVNCYNPILSRDENGFNATGTSNQKDPFLNHVLKQINSLKVENLELKKMINDRVFSQQRSRSQQSQRKVSISIDNDLEPIHSLRSINKSKTPKDRKFPIQLNNSTRAKSLSKPFWRKSRNKSEVSNLSRISKKSGKETKRSNVNSKKSKKAQGMYLNKYSRVPTRKGSRDPVTTYQRHVMPLGKAALRASSSMHNSSESGSLYLDKTDHISLGRHLKSTKYAQMKPRWKVEWDLNGRRKDAQYINSRLNSKDHDPRAAHVSQQRAQRLNNIGSHLVSKCTLGGGLGTSHPRTLKKSSSRAQNRSVLLKSKSNKVFTRSKQRVRLDTKKKVTHNVVQDPWRPA